MRLHQNKVGGTHLLVGGVSLFTLLILGAMVFPTLPQTAQAEEAESKVSLSVAPVISLSLQDTVAVEVTPTQDGTFSSNTAALSISTNNETGYSLYMATSNSENTLTSQNPSISNVISAVNGGDNGVTSADFGNNTWGYNLSQETVSDATAYKAVPTATGDTAIISTSSPAEADNYNLTFGTKVDTSLPSGTYSNNVVVSVVANPAFAPVFDGIQTMQEMTSTICADTAENDTAQLTDTRDGKKYWVTKLADGNCWMTQNLDLDLYTSKALTPDDSDVSSNWTPTNSTLADGTQTTTDYTAVWSWNLGDYVLTTPNAGTSCGTSGISDFGDCTGVGFQSIAGMAPMTDGNATDVISDNTYNAHYHVGNHYTWNAATAGTGGTITSTNATDSICPKGWQLPTSNNSNSGSFQALTNAYSISSNTDGSTALVSAPLYFVRSGNVDSGSLRYAGNSGGYWSSTAYSSTSRAYRLSFDSGYVDPSYDLNRYFGQSVRCLAR